jgi:hydrogenase expression/formation protein HypD
MKYIDEYRDPKLAQGLFARIGRLAERIGQPVTIMEVCGSHTAAIGRFGIRKLLPRDVRLLSGPGCPVCVTAIEDVDQALFLAGQRNTVFATFGDMLRVPGTAGASLQKARAAGADVRMVLSALDCIDLAETCRDKEIVFMGIGFETTSPTVAAVVKTCLKKKIHNLSVFSVHKVIPPALRVLIEDPALRIDGFLCPGHVSTIIGAEAYRLIPDAGRAAVITGFEPVDILEGIAMLLEQILSDQKTVAIQYSRGVRAEGNLRARELLADVFQAAPSVWRGLGMIPASGLTFREAYQSFDARQRFEIPPLRSEEIKGCSCGDILRGVKTPDGCPLFGRLCTPLNPVGPCMVSSEGTCAAYFNYR